MQEDAGYGLQDAGLCTEALCIFRHFNRQSPGR